MQDVQSVGRKYDVKEVRDGYARNFLFPRALAAPATGSALKTLAADKERAEETRARDYQTYRALVEKMKLTTLTFTMKMGEKGKAFGSITAVKIRDALKKQGIAVDKDWILLEEPIKTTGEHTIQIKLPQDIKTEVKVVVEAE